jgi:hypothetical protein
MVEPPVLRLTHRELAVAVALITSPGHAVLDRADARGQLAALRRAGVLDERGVPAEPAATTLRAVARPLVRVEIRRTTGDEVAELRAWADEAHAVTGRMRGEVAELQPVPRETLPRALVRDAGLAGGRAAAPGDTRAPIAVAPPVLLAAREQIRAGDGAEALATLHAAGLAGRAAGEALAIAEAVRLAFVAIASWREPDGEWHTGTVAGVDAGPAGWWSLSPGSPDGALEPTDAHRLAARLVGLLP